LPAPFSHKADVKDAFESAERHCRVLSAPSYPRPEERQNLRAKSKKEAEELN
jgi:hypothetical protein